MENGDGDRYKDGRYNEGSDDGGDDRGGDVSGGDESGGRGYGKNACKDGGDVHQCWGRRVMRVGVYLSSKLGF